MSSIDPDKLKSFVDEEFETKVLPSFKEYLTIPCTSPAYDSDWEKNDYLKKAADLLKAYAKSLSISGLDCILEREERKTPFLITTIDGTSKDNKTILFYGHFDKQPAGDGWSEGIEPYSPIIKDNYIYARGSADDGYSFYSILTLVRALKNQNILHPKIVILIEGSEESGSIDLPYYLDEFIDLIGEPNIIFSLDSGACDYNRIWLTQSLRGSAVFDVTVNTLKQGVHSGKYSGIAPESFMILRKIISKIENYDDKFISLKDFEVEIPENVKTNAEQVVNVIGESLVNLLPLLPGVEPLGNEKKFTTDLYLNSTWKPSLAVVGIQGVPAIKDAGNVLRPYTSARIGIRTPPTFDSVKYSKKIIQDAFTVNTPFNATITTSNFNVENGISLPDPSDKFIYSLSTVSKNYMESTPVAFSVGVSIPFVYIVSQYFPNSQFIVTGAAGVDCNAHGPNERLNLIYTKKFICSLAHLIAEYKNYL